MRKLQVSLAVACFLFSGGALTLCWREERPKPGKLEWRMETKKTIMTFAYKTYGNPSAVDGRMYLHKTVFTNLGRGPVRDIEISYHIPEYVSWTTPDRYAELLPEQTLVDVYYPKLPHKVTSITSRTPATLETRISWSEESGRRKEEVFKREFEFRGLNEIEYTSMPSEEIVSWHDMFENIDLSAAFVSPEDPVVKLFAAEVTQQAGGTAAGAGGETKEVLRLMKTFYDYQVATGMHYASAKGVPEKLGDVNSRVQSVRLPREVITNGSGLCIELAILWSSVMECLGVKTYMVVIPGHAFTIVLDGKGQMIPVECTGINGPGLGGSLTFEKAVESATKTLGESKFRKILDIQKLQSAGIRPPELPATDLDSLRQVLAKRRQGNRIAGADQGRGAAGAALVGTWTAPLEFNSEYGGFGGGMQTMVFRPDGTFEYESVYNYDPGESNAGGEAKSRDSGVWNLEGSILNLKSATTGQTLRVQIAFAEGGRAVVVEGKAWWRT